MKALICEHEPTVNKHLAALLKSQGHEVIEYTSHLDEAYHLTLQHHPEMVFVNAHLPRLDEYSQKISQDLNNPPAIIYVGAEDASLIINALKSGASDYLPTSFQENDLKNALQRCCRINAAQQAILNEQSGKQGRARQYIAARTHRGVELISLSDVYYFTADQKYVKVRHKNGVVLIDETLKDLEEEFAGVMFRIHRNALINLDYLDLLETVDNGQYQVRFRDIPEKLSVSRRHLPTLREKIQGI